MDAQTLLLMKNEQTLLLFSFLCSSLGGQTPFSGTKSSKILELEFDKFLDFVMQCNVPIFEYQKTGSELIMLAPLSFPFTLMTSTRLQHRHTTFPFPYNFCCCSTRYSCFHIILFYFIYFFICMETPICYCHKLWCVHTVFFMQLLLMVRGDSEQTAKKKTK